MNVVKYLMVKYVWIKVELNDEGLVVMICDDGMGVEDVVECLVELVFMYLFKQWCGVLDV